MRRKIPITLTIEEIQKIINIPNENLPTGLRNKAILSFIWDSGARVSDVINLRPGNINIGKREATVICGKGGIDRHLSYSEYTARLLLKYKNQRPKGNFFFCTEYKTNNPKYKKGKIANKLDRIYLYSMIRKYAQRAGIKKRIGCHTLRHSFALNFYKNSEHDLISLQKILGHKNINTTTIYAYMDGSAVKESLEAYYKQRDHKNFEDKDIAEQIKELAKEIQLLKANI
ncbi:Tyrosine recombinase XerD [subsurface metagenome]